MTNKLTDLEIARVFAMYIGAPCAIYDYAAEPDRWEPAEVEGVDLRAEKPIIAERVNWAVSEVKLILVPMEYTNPFSCYSLIKQLKIEADNIYKIAKSQIGMHNLALQSLFKNGIENELYISSNQWANNKTAFDLGIAIPHRGYLFELARQCYPNEDQSKACLDVLDYARELGHNIDTKEGMLAMIKVLQDIKALYKKTSK